jgi:hypothetical protein
MNNTSLHGLLHHPLLNVTQFIKLFWQFDLALPGFPIIMDHPNFASNLGTQAEWQRYDMLPVNSHYISRKFTKILFGEKSGWRRTG